MEQFKYSNEPIVAEWQHIVEVLAEIMNVPSAIVTRIAAPYVEVFRASSNEQNPYHAGQVVELANHYCEEVFKTGERLLLPNAHKSERWRNAPEIDYDMVSYLGYPIKWPDGSVFGTICVLDSKENTYSKNYEALLAQFSAMLENHLLLFRQKERLEAQLREIDTLRGIIPICAQCKNVRNDEGYWEQVEAYVAQRSLADFSHGLCPVCTVKAYEKWEEEARAWES